ncbi:LysR family transcriptional regulator [Mycobacterium sp. MBM]|nr:LysR family transcriptional regulator [Mycobacterium sp. MBM]
MNIEELQWFVTLAETEHVTDAAAELGISQPTLSRSLARLEAQVGAPLFDRLNRRLRLNSYGEVLLEHAQRSIDEMRSATERIAALRDPETGIVRLAFLHSQAGGFVPDLLRRFRLEAPRVQFELFQGAAHSIVHRLATGQADLAITSPRPSNHPWRVLYVERLCLAVPRGHRFAERSRLRLADAADEPFVALRPEFGLRLLTDELCREAGIAPPVVFEAMEIPTMEGLVAAGFGVAVVPVPRSDRAEPGAVYIPLGETTAKRQIGLTWSPERELAPAARRLADFIMQVGNDIA